MAANTKPDKPEGKTAENSSSQSWAKADQNTGKPTGDTTEQHKNVASTDLRYQGTREDDSDEQSFEPRRLVRRTSTNTWSVSDSIVDFRESGGSFTSERNHGDWEHAHSGRRKKKTSA
ncbi:hypothetical protein LTR70_008961 [Exophiala xenobiotica]|uniref:Uncharacterized protein n=1 Tax=Lithohypha guttulata TaxID=1690604 RepID=A0ABR0K0R7_9EURO|nr:hypothetical protein LTR24_008697 [Lithohypha guttulata]KAK5311198.1 hypothetical protein LTR70_008961 [Exophiala xenobiotica]